MEALDQGFYRMSHTASSLFTRNPKRDRHQALDELFRPFNRQLSDTRVYEVDGEIHAVQWKRHGDVIFWNLDKGTLDDLLGALKRPGYRGEKSDISRVGAVALIVLAYEKIRARVPGIDLAKPLIALVRNPEINPLEKLLALEIPEVRAAVAQDMPDLLPVWREFHQKRQRLLGTHPEKPPLVPVRADGIQTLQEQRAHADAAFERASIALSAFTSTFGAGMPLHDIFIDGMNGWESLLGQTPYHTFYWLSFGLTFIGFSAAVITEKTASLRVNRDAQKVTSEMRVIENDLQRPEVPELVKPVLEASLAIRKRLLGLLK